MATDGVVATLYASVVGCLVGVASVQGFSPLPLLLGTLITAYLAQSARSLAANPQHYFPLLAIATLLMLVGGYSFAASHVFVPAGLLSTVSALVFIRYGIRLIQDA